MDHTAARPAGSAPAMRRKYWARLGGRCLAALAAVGCYLLQPSAFAVLEGMAFFHGLTPLHLLWLVWMGDMLLQLRPARAVMALGSQKQFGRYYQPGRRAGDKEALAGFIRESDRGARRVFLIWALVIAGIGALKRSGLLGRAEIFLTVAFFYVCDLVCVLVWCPFRVFWMKNRCCTTCRIFNWDHLMMFTPFLFVSGFYGGSLLALSVVVFLVWEAAFRLHPERFWEGSNQALSCKNCTDRLCGR